MPKKYFITSISDGLYEPSRCNWNLPRATHVQLFSRVKSKLSFKSIICSFFFTRLYEQIIDLYIIYLVNLGRLCIQYFSNILLEDCNNSLSKLRQIMS